MDIGTIAIRLRKIMYDPSFNVDGKVLVISELETKCNIENRKICKDEGFKWDWERRAWIKFMTEDEYLSFSKFNLKQVETKRK